MTPNTIGFDCQFLTANGYTSFRPSYYTYFGHRPTPGEPCRLNPAPSESGDPGISYLCLRFVRTARLCVSSNTPEPPPMVAGFNTVIARNVTGPTKQHICCQMQVRRRMRTESVPVTANTRQNTNVVANSSVPCDDCRYDLWLGIVRSTDRQKPQTTVSASLQNSRRFPIRRCIPTRCFPPRRWPSAA